MQDTQQKLKRKLTLIFWLNIAVFIALSLFMVTLVGITGKSETKEDFMWERFAIILTVAAIPFSLKFFHTQYKKIQKLDLKAFLPKVEKLYYFRLLILDLTIVLNLIGFYYIGALNFIYLAAITIFAFLMCYPTETLIDPIEKEIIEEEDIENTEDLTNDKND